MAGGEDVERVRRADDDQVVDVRRAIAWRSASGAASDRSGGASGTTSAK